MKVAIIGAGLAGLTLARSLSSLAEVQLFEKSRGIGGRLASRRFEEFRFDHGAPSFEASGTNFKDFIAEFKPSGVVTAWPKRVAEINDGTLIKISQPQRTCHLFTGRPTINAIAKELAQNVSIAKNCPIKRLEKSNGGWTLYDDQGVYSGFDWLFITAPPAQTLNLLPSTTSLKDAITSIAMKPCIVLMLGLNQAIDLGYDAAVLNDEMIRWVSVEHTKPDRSHASVVVHSSHAWAERYIDADQQLNKQLLSKAVTRLIPAITPQSIVHTDLHAWRYATNAEYQSAGYFLDTHNALGVCGDWCLQGNAESAFESATLLSKKLTELKAFLS